MKILDQLVSNRQTDIQPLRHPGLQTEPKLSPCVPVFTGERYEGQEPLQGDVLLVGGGLRDHRLLTQLTRAGNSGATRGAVEVTLATWIDIVKLRFRSKSGEGQVTEHSDQDLSKTLIFYT